MSPALSKGYVADMLERNAKSVCEQQEFFTASAAPSNLAYLIGRQLRRTMQFACIAITQNLTSVDGVRFGRNVFQIAQVVVRAISVFVVDFGAPFRWWPDEGTKHESVHEPLFTPPVAHQRDAAIVLRVPLILTNLTRLDVSAALQPFNAPARRYREDAFKTWNFTPVFHSPSRSTPSL